MTSLCSLQNCDGGSDTIARTDFDWTDYLTGWPLVFANIVLPAADIGVMAVTTTMRWCIDTPQRITSPRQQYPTSRTTTHSARRCVRIPTDRPFNPPCRVCDCSRTMSLSLAEQPLQPRKADRARQRAWEALLLEAVETVLWL